MIRMKITNRRSYKKLRIQKEGRRGDLSNLNMQRERNSCGIVAVSCHVISKPKCRVTSLAQRQGISVIVMLLQLDSSGEYAGRRSLLWFPRLDSLILTALRSSMDTIVGMDLVVKE